MNTTLKYTAARDLAEEPVFLPCELPAERITSVMTGSNVYPAVAVEGGILAILCAKQGETITLTTGTEDCGNCTAVVKDQTVELNIAGKHFADYVASPDFPKPHLGPVTDDRGNPFTRCEQMHAEHPHQRSIIVAIGDVNGVDCWNEQKNCGYVRNESIRDVISSPAFAAFTACNRWTDHDGAPLLTENTRYIVYNQSDACRTLDMKITFSADYGDVVFGPTKEAGPLGIRLRDELRADIGHGTLLNSRGGVGETECWGKEAEWCDYHGTLDGIGEMGVTVFDGPSNERYPTAWHIRSYGLFAANNLHFKGGYTLPSGNSITYRYRILFRKIEMTSEDLADRYSGYLSSMPDNL
ncbi:MAG: PmoA family protein [Eubacteriales bacterium]